MRIFRAVGLIIFLVFASMIFGDVLIAFEGAAEQFFALIEHALQKAQSGI
jgi:hypothetical protein